MIPIPKDIPLTIKSELISVKYLIHVTLDIPHATDVHVNLPIAVTTQSVLESNQKSAIWNTISPTVCEQFYLQCNKKIFLIQ